MTLVVGTFPREGERSSTTGELLVSPSSTPAGEIGFSNPSDVYCGDRSSKTLC
jgi:hypothetical protein